MFYLKHKSIFLVIIEHFNKKLGSNVNCEHVILKKIPVVSWLYLAVSNYF